MKLEITFERGMDFNTRCVVFRVNNPSCALDQKSISEINTIHDCFIRQSRNDEGVLELFFEIYVSTKTTISEIEERMRKILAEYEKKCEEISRLLEILAVNNIR